MLAYAKQLPENNRIEILQAVELILDRWKDGELHTSVAFPPRYGKSDVIRISALEARTISSHPAIVAAPWEDNVEQIGITKKIEGMYSRYGIARTTPFLAHRCRSLKTHSWWNQISGVPTLVGVTLGLINNKANQQQFLDGIADIYQRSSRRAMVFVDECQLVKRLQEYGKLCAKVIEEGGYLVLLTGTPVPGIPGFEEICGEWEEIKRRLPRRSFVDGQIKYFVETYEGRRRTVDKVKANIDVEWQRAFEIGALSKVNAVWVDVDVVEKDTAEPVGPLSELSVSDLSGRLRDIQESPELMARMSLAGVERLLQKRSKKFTRAARMLVITGADDKINGDEANRHAKSYKAKIIQALESVGQNPEEYRIEIATGVDNDGWPSKEAKNTIDAFREGKVDVLIVKSMGIVGLDVPECKVLVFGSTLRDGPMAVQALSRALTAWGHAVADLVLPRDVKMVQLFDRVVSDNSGLAQETDLLLIEKEEIAPPEDDRPEWKYDFARIDGYSDERGGLLSGDHELVLRAIRRRYPDEGLTDLQIIRFWQAGAFPLSETDIHEEEMLRRTEEESGIKNLDEGLEEASGEFGSKARRIVSKYISYGDRDRWLSAVKEIQSIAKDMCGCAKVSVPHIDDVALLQKLCAALDEAEWRKFGNG